MVARKRKKNTRQRGGTTHGWGSMKKHRGKGNKGGAGMAGTGKRGDAKKPSIWKRKYFGRFGFRKKGIIKKVNSINIELLQAQLESWSQANKIKKEGDTSIIDLKELGFDKLLGRGLVKNKMNITVESASEKAISKVTEKGGQVTVRKEE